MEDDLALLMTVWISDMEIGTSLNSTDGSLGVGIHGAYVHIHEGAIVIQD